MSATTGATLQDPSDVCSLAGALKYLTFTRLDIAYAVQQVCLHVHDPQETHLAALKCILCYIRGALHMGLIVRPSTMDDLVAYSDFNWAGYSDTRKSTLGYAVFLGDKISSPSRPSVKLIFPTPVLKLSITLLLMVLLKLPGCTSF